MRRERCGRWLVLLAAIAPVVAAAAPLGAQQKAAGPELAEAPAIPAVRAPYAEGLDRSYVFVTAPGDKVHTWYEATLAPSYVMFDNLQRTLDVGDGEGRRHAMRFALTMNINVRQTTENSAPVRTPSYNPKALVTWTQGVRTGQFMRTLSATATFGHYSNGQDGCLYDGQVDTDCHWPGAVPARPAVNRRDGSFSSHYLQVDGAWRRMSVSGDIALTEPRLQVVRQDIVRLTTRAYSPLSGVGGGMVGELSQAYGPTRVRLTVERDQFLPTRRWWRGHGHQRLLAWSEYIAGGSALRVPRWRGAAEWGVTDYTRAGAGPFVRLYYGQDDYNLGFTHNLGLVLHLGLSFDPERLPTIRM